MLIVVVGPVGSGKTLIATAIALDDPNKRQILANYTIKDPRAKMVNLEDINDISKPSIVIFDEAYVAMDSYTSGSAVNRFLSFKLFQSRKDDTSFICTLQRFKRLDVNFRSQVSLVILCKRRKDGFSYRFLNPNTGKTYVRLLSNENASHIWAKYDTKQKVDPINKELLYQVASSNRKLNEDIDTIVNEMLSLGNDPWTMARTSDYCLRNDIPRSLVRDIYYRLRSTKVEK
jgi:hypothetical protein